MDFQHKQGGKHSFFTAHQDGQKAGEVSYYPSGKNTITLDHTLVEDGFQGQQLGRKLVDQVVNYARENDLKIVPQCSYAHRLFEKDSVYADIWQKEAPDA